MLNSLERKYSNMEIRAVTVRVHSMKTEAEQQHTLRTVYTSACYISTASFTESIESKIILVN